MNRHRLSLFGLVLILSLPSLAGGQEPAAKPQSTGEKSPPDGQRQPATEEELIAAIREALGSPSQATSDEEEFDRAARASLRGLELIDEFLKRYPNSPARDDVLIQKLSLLSDLARFDPGHLGLLLTTTEEIADSRPTGRLATECDYFAILAFVMAARHENMPERTRLVGTAERYRAFLEDHPDSPRGPVVFASLARCLLGLGLLSDAERTLAGMKRFYPDHPATRRVEGEVGIAKAVGQSLPLDLAFSDGSKFASADHTGKVIVLGFWSSVNGASTEFLREMGRLHKAHADKPVQIEAVCLDGPRTQQAARSEVFQSSVTFPQHYESKGVRSDVVVSLGVVELPTSLVLDRKGVLRAVLSSEKTAELAALLEKLLAEAP